MIYVARGLISLIFLYGGIGKIFNWQGSLEETIRTFSEWTIYFPKVHDRAIGAAPYLLGVATFLEVVGALLLLIGYKPKLASFLLLLFLLPTTVIFHSFWFEIGSDFKKELGIFLKNFALVGALLYLFIVPRVEKAK